MYQLFISHIIHRTYVNRIFTIHATQPYSDSQQSVSFYNSVESLFKLFIIILPKCHNNFKRWPFQHVNMYFDLPIMTRQYYCLLQILLPLHSLKAGYKAKHTNDVIEFPWLGTLKRGSLISPHLLERERRIGTCP